MTMKNLLASVFLMLLLSCSTPKQEAPPEVQSAYKIASAEYVDISKNAFTLLSEFDFDSWSKLLADDVEYYFPDGDVDTRTSLVGKIEVVAWWTNWKNSAGIKSMSFSAGNYVPIDAAIPQNTTGMDGVYVLSYFSNKMEFDNGNTVRLRMNMITHFNEEKLVDRIYSYYDRTPIIEAMQTNILRAAEEDN
jgi:hypothetical protein